MKYNQLLPMLALCAALSIISCDNTTQPATDDKEELAELTLEDKINHGEYLVSIMGCNDCHSPKRMGERGPEIIPELMLSGYPSDRPVVEFDSKLIKEGFAMFYPDLTAASGPWGISFAGNLTPHDTGIGNWTEEQFIRAMSEGKYKGLENGRMLLPPMPWYNYARMKKEDLSAVYAYLMSVDPVDNVVPAAKPPLDL